MTVRKKIILSVTLPFPPLPRDRIVRLTAFPPKTHALGGGFSSGVEDLISQTEGLLASKAGELGEICHIVGSS